jgi:chloramphenicol 3-O-phosphotransferase
VRHLLVIIGLMVILSGQRAMAQDVPLITKEVLVLQSTRDYKTALATARQAAARLHTTLDLEGYQPNPQSGLTMSKADCADNGFGYPTYVARGRQVEKQSYVSIEYSNGYNGFAHGYYLVVAAVGETGSAVVRDTSAAARRWYPDAYAKQTQVWVGCIH